MSKYNYPIGSVSSGTMREEDLIPEFMWTLKQLYEAKHDNIAEEYSEEIENAGSDDLSDNQRESIFYFLNEVLFDSISGFAGPYFYFGAHPCDGAHYGFWFCEDSFNDAVHDGEVIKVDELPERLIAQENQEYFAVVTDHGNITLYDLNGVEVWSIV